MLSFKLSLLCRCWKPCCTSYKDFSYHWDSATKYTSSWSPATTFWALALPATAEQSCNLLPVYQQTQFYRPKPACCPNSSPTASSGTTRYFADTYIVLSSYGMMVSTTNKDVHLYTIIPLRCCDGWPSVWTTAVLQKYILTYCNFHLNARQITLHT